MRRCRTVASYHFRHERNVICRNHRPAGSLEVPPRCRTRLPMHVTLIGEKLSPDVDHLVFVSGIIARSHCWIHPGASLAANKLRFAPMLSRMERRRVVAAAIVSLFGLCLTGCGEAPKTVAIRTLNGTPDDYAGGILGLLGEQYHAEWADDGEVLSVSAVFASTCVAVPTRIASDRNQAISITLEPHQTEFPCTGGDHAVTFLFDRPKTVDSSRPAELKVGTVQVDIRPGS